MENEMENQQIEESTALLELPQFDRIRNSTGEAANFEIDQQILRNVEAYSHSPETIERRLAELDHEWDIDRALMANFSVIAFSALLLGIFRNRKWLALPAIQIPFLFLHASRGWCPPLPLLRRLGFRSRQEIEAEKMELRKAGARNYTGSAIAVTIEEVSNF